MKKLLFLIAVTMIIVSCEKNEIKEDPRDKIIGTWKVIDYSGDWRDETDYCNFSKTDDKNEISWSLNELGREKKLIQYGQDSFSTEGIGIPFLHSEFNTIYYRNDTLFGTRSFISLFFNAAYYNKFVMIKE